ncbi:MAG: hypothetical protein KDA60_05985 [Planctomycetales bacterium]|nr:hypothetical protein [Planctomycetales bacterium]
MPSSRPHTIPTVIGILKDLQPQSILDVGVGFGKWGHLFREYTDIVASENDPARYQKRNWKVRIDGIEGFESYLTDMHRYIYDELHVGHASEVIETLGNYDMIFMGDVIEHFEKQDGISFLDAAWKRANKAVVISTPWFDIEQLDICENDLERHRSHWTPQDFDAYGHVQAFKGDGDILIAVMTKPQVTPPRCQAPRPPGRLSTVVRNSAIRILGEKRFQQIRSTLSDVDNVPSDGVEEPVGSNS